MLNLQKKAHYSLDEFRKGRSPITRSEPPTPADDNDELSVLGGKTRLVAKQEPSSPTIMDRSPTSHNPVVPLPLSPSMEGQVHPSIWEYLDSFVPQQAQQVHNQNQGRDLSRQQSSSPTGIPSNPSSYSEDVSMFGMSSLPTASSFQTEPASYLVNRQAPGHQLSHVRQASHPPQQMGNMQTSSAGPLTNGALSYPQYFPVYDYGNAITNGGNYINGSGFGSSSVPEATLSHGQRRSSGPHEGNMHSTWQDFVSEMAM